MHRVFGQMKVHASALPIVLHHGAARAQGRILQGAYVSAYHNQSGTAQHFVNFVQPRWEME